MKKAVQYHQYHEVSDEDWILLEPYLPGQPGQWGGVAHDNRRFLNAVFWILRTGAPWRNLPSVYGDWKNVHRRFCRWRSKGIWESLLEQIIEEPGYEWLMVANNSYREAHHSHATEAQGNGQEMNQREPSRYIWPWMRLMCRSELLLQRLPEQLVRKHQRSDISAHQ
jgi:transposase